MNTKTCGARAVVAAELLAGGNSLATHQTHTCVRTDLDESGDHLGLHTCACGAGFTSAEDQESPEPPQPHDWAEAVHERLRNLERRQHMTSARMASMADAGTQLSAGLAEVAIAILGLDKRIDEMTTAATVGEAVRSGAEAAAARALATVEASMMDGAPRAAVIRQFVLELLHMARGHALDLDVDVATPGQSASECQECRAEADQRMRLYVSRRMQTSQRPDPAERFWRLFNGDTLTAAEAGERVASAGVSEIAAGAPATIVVKYMLAEAIHIQERHPASQRGRACSQCLSAAGKLLELRPAPGSVMAAPASKARPDQAAMDEVQAASQRLLAFMRGQEDEVAAHGVSLEELRKMSHVYGLGPDVWLASTQPPGVNLAEDKVRNEYIVQVPSGDELYLIGRDERGNVDPVRSARLDLSGVKDRSGVDPSAAERLAGLQDITGTFLGTPVPCSRVHQEVAEDDAARLCGTCGASVSDHPNWANQPGNGGTVRIGGIGQPRRPFAEAVERIAERARSHGADVNVTWNGPGQATVSVGGITKDEVADSLAEVAAPDEEAPEVHPMDEVLGGPDEEDPF